ncbi:MAG: hypothetical protein D6731_22450 [Planctomycetota bacterium]|nr:MAG: hypothetical protein D6731_22450 [Planctomycetota bacterium]
MSAAADGPPSPAERPDRGTSPAPGTPADPDAGRGKEAFLPPPASEGSSGRATSAAEPQTAGGAAPLAAQEALRHGEGHAASAARNRIAAFAAAEDSFAPGQYSTLLDVREALSADAAPDEQRATLERTLARAARRLDRLRRQGHRPHDLEGRLRAAEALAEQDELRAALLLVEEVLVLAKVLAEFGPPASAPEARLDEAVERALERGSAAARLRALEERLEKTIAKRAHDAAAALERDFSRAVSALGERLARGLADLLRSEEFRAAAAEATAARPQALLERPELLARVEAVASREARALLESAAFREAARAEQEPLLDALRRELAHRQDPAPDAPPAALRGSLRELLPELLSELLPKALREAPPPEEATRPRPSGLAEDEVRRLLAEEFARRLDPAALARTPEFGRVLEARFKELLVKEFKKRRKRG